MCQHGHHLDDAGAALASICVLVSHHCAIFGMGLHFFSTIFDHFYWPGPLRKRATRRKLKDVICAILALVAACLVLSNSAVKPSPIADKWFPVPSSLQRGTQKPTVSPSLQQPAATLQLQSFAEEPSLQLRGTEIQEPDATAVTSDPRDMSAQKTLSTAEPVAAFPLPHRPSAHCSVAIIVATSRSLMLLPSSLGCPAVLSSWALNTEIQHTLLVKPVLPSLLVYHHTSKQAAHVDSSIDPMPAAAAHLGGVLPPVYADWLCNASCECCLTDSPSSSTAAPAARHSIVVEHAAQTIAAILPDLRSWSWFQTLLFGSFIFSLGAIVPGNFTFPYSYKSMAYVYWCGPPLKSHKASYL